MIQFQNHMIYLELRKIPDRNKTLKENLILILILNMLHDFKFKLCNIATLIAS